MAAPSLAARSVYTDKEGDTMMTDLRGELMRARFDELHAEANRQRCVLLAKSMRHTERPGRTSGPRHHLPRWVSAAR